jgi:hypothetical protein
LHSVGCYLSQVCSAARVVQVCLSGCGHRGDGLCNLCADVQISLKDERKLEYALEAMRGPSPFVNEEKLEPSVEEALLWQSSRSAQEVIAEREAMICSLERAGALMWETGAAVGWSEGCDSDIAKVCLSVRKR